MFIVIQLQECQKSLKKFNLILLNYLYFLFAFIQACGYLLFENIFSIKPNNLFILFFYKLKKNLNKKIFKI